MKPISYHILIFAFCLFIQTSKAQDYFSNRYDNFNNGDINTGIAWFGNSYLTYGCTANTSSLYSLNLGLTNLGGTRIINKTYNYYSNLLIPNNGKPILHYNNQFSIAGTRFYKTDTSLVFLWRFNANLDSITYKEYGYLNKINQIFALIKGTGNSIYLAGSVDSLYKNSDILLIKTDTLGNEIWKKKIGIPGWDETAYCINICANSDLLISGIKTAHGGSQQGPYVMRADSSGVIIWQNYYPSANYANGSNDIKELINGNIVFTGGKAYNITPNGTLRKPTFTCLSGSGSMIWQKEYGIRAVGHDFFKFLINERNHFVVSGEIFKTDNTGSGMVYELNQNGDSLFSREYRLLPNSQNYFRDVVQAPDKGYCFSGFVTPMNSDGGTQDIWLLKVDSNFCESQGICITGIHNMEKDGITGVYPNPARYNLTVLVPYEAQTHGNLILTDALGNILKTIATTGEETQQLNMESYATGIYFLKIESPRYFKTYKIIKD